MDIQLEGLSRKGQLSRIRSTTPNTIPVSQYRVPLGAVILSCGTSVFQHDFTPENPPMTPPEPQDDSMTMDEFDGGLERLVAAARDANVPIEGAHNVRSPRSDVPDYTIEISEIADRNPLSQ